MKKALWNSNCFRLFDENKCNCFLIFHHFELKSICIVNTSSKLLMTVTSSTLIFTKDSTSIKKRLHLKNEVLLIYAP